MSHFTVTVCVLDDDELSEKGIEQRITEILAPYDENRDDIEPWRSYEDGSPDNFWWVRSVRREAESHRTGEHDEDWIKRQAEELMPSDERYGRGRREPNANELAAARDKVKRECAEAAEWDTRLGDNPTWQTVVELHNEKWHPGNRVTLPSDVDTDEIDTERLHYDPDTDRAYTWSLGNPQGHWDWWVIGGRWQRHLVATKDANPDLLVSGRPGSGGDSGDPHTYGDGQVCCDGGPRTMLDFDAMRDRAGAEAAERYDKRMALIAEHGTALGWSHFVGLAEVGEITWDEARQQYGSQPLVAAHRALPYEDQLVGFSGCIVDSFALGREDYIQTARDRSVPGFALVDLDGAWHAPGKMGWFATTDATEGTRDAYYAQASRYLDELPSNAWVVQLDCHI